MERRTLVAALAAAALVWIALAAPLFRGQIYFARDLGLFHLPLRHFYANALEAGHAFIWFPHAFSGFFLHGDGQLGLLHPLNWLHYSLLPFVPAFTLEIVRAYAFALLGGYLLLRRWSLRRDASVLGAALFAYGSFNLLAYVLVNATAVAAHIPWLLWAIDIALRGGPRAAWAFPCVVLLTASQLLLSHPQTAWMSLLAAGGYAVLLGVPLWQSDRGAALQRMALLAAALAVGALIASVQLLPQWEALQDAPRSEPHAGFTEQYPLLPVFLAQPLAPYLFWRQVPGLPPTGMALYCGAAVPILLAWLLAARRRLGARAPLAWGALAFAGVALWLSLGDAGGLYRLQQALPIAGLFRAPGRYVLLFQLGVAIAAAISFDDLARVVSNRGGGRDSRIVWVPVAASLALTSLGVALASRSPHWLLPDFSLILLGPALLAVAAGLVTIALRGREWALVAFALFAIVELGGFGLAYVQRSNSIDLQALLDDLSDPPLGRGYRLDIAHPALTMNGVSLASGYAGLHPAGVLPIGRPPGPATAATARRAALRVAGIDSAPADPHAPLARARMLAQAVASEDVVREMARLDVAKIALVDAALPDLAGAPGQAQIVRDEPGEIEIETRADGRQLLVVAEHFHRGWRAEVDGTAQPVIRVYGDFMGTVLPPGAHDVTLHFAPDSLRYGVWATAAGLTVLLAWAALLVKRRSA